ncbi:MAG: ATP-dependent protease ATPase subunit HslU [Chloroflexota bacterium]
MTELTPAMVVRELDRYIVGQKEAKKAVAIALCTRERRKKVPDDMRREIIPKNILMIGPTGVGKTEIARRVAGLLNAPFVKVEATKFTEVGYVGRDADSIIGELVESSFMRVYERRLKEVETKAETLANEKLVRYVCQQLAPESPKRARVKIAGVSSGAGRTVPRRGPDRRLVAKLLETSKLDDQMVEIEVSDEAYTFDTSFATDYSYYYDDYADGYGDPRFHRSRSQKRKVSIKEARRILKRVEANKLLDINQVVDEAVHHTEENGVVFIDELDKLIGPKVEVGRDISGEGVQRDLLPLLEGTTVMTRFGPVKTDHILYVAAGAFHQSKPSELIAELQGRLPIRVELSRLALEDLERILTEPANALTKQYQALMAAEGVELEFAADGIREIAHYAVLMNERAENIGARRLSTVMEKVLEDLSFTASERRGEKVVVDAVYVRDRVARLVKDEDLSRYIL